MTGAWFDAVTAYAVGVVVGIALLFALLGIGVVALAALRCILVALVRVCVAIAAIVAFGARHAWRAIRRAP